jgi:hypothetical protein
VLVGVVEQQVAGELADLVGAEPAGKSSTLGLIKKPLWPEVNLITELKIILLLGVIAALYLMIRRLRSLVRGGSSRPEFHRLVSRELLFMAGRCAMAVGVLEAAWHHWYGFAILVFGFSAVGVAMILGKLTGR